MHDVNWLLRMHAAASSERRRRFWLSGAGLPLYGRWAPQGGNTRESNAPSIGGGVWACLASTARTRGHAGPVPRGCCASGSALYVRWRTIDVKICRSKTAAVLMRRIPVGSAVNRNLLTLRRLDCPSRRSTNRRVCAASCRLSASRRIPGSWRVCWAILQP